MLHVLSFSSNGSQQFSIVYPRPRLVCHVHLPRPHFVAVGVKFGCTEIPVPGIDTAPVTKCVSRQEHGSIFSDCYGAKGIMVRRPGLSHKR